MGTTVIPTDYAWSTWTLTNVTNNTSYIIGTASGGTAVSPAYTATSGYAWDKITLTGEDQYGLKIEVKTATASAGLTSATYFEARNDCTFPLDEQKRYSQIRLTFTQNSDSSYPTVRFLTATYELGPPTDSVGLSTDAKGAQPTWDHAFEGRLYQCAICGGTYHRREMSTQRGKLVCKETCKDLRKNFPSDIQVRNK